LVIQGAAFLLAKIGSNAEVLDVLEVLEVLEVLKESKVGAGRW